MALGSHQHQELLSTTRLMLEDYGETQDNRHHLTDGNMNSILIKLTAATTLTHAHATPYTTSTHTSFSEASRLGLCNTTFQQHSTSLALEHSSTQHHPSNTDTSTTKSTDRRPTKHSHSLKWLLRSTQSISLVPFSSPSFCCDRFADRQVLKMTQARKLKDATNNLQQPRTRDTKARPQYLNSLYGSPYVLAP
jgi:hypothetical protein